MTDTFPNRIILLVNFKVISSEVSFMTEKLKYYVLTLFENASAIFLIDCCRT